MLMQLPFPILELNPSHSSSLPTPAPNQLSKLIIPKSRAAIHRDLDSVPDSISVWETSQRSRKHPPSPEATINPSARGQIHRKWMAPGSQSFVGQSVSQHH